SSARESARLAALSPRSSIKAWLHPTARARHCTLRSQQPSPRAGCRGSSRKERVRKPMHLSRIKILNFRNFSELDVSLSGNVVVVGENRVGKSNLLYALRLIFDPSLPDSARQLGLSDFWDGLEDGPSVEDKILISVEIKNLEDDEDVLAVLTDYRLDEDLHTVR